MLVPIALGVAVLVAIGLLRSLQAAAFKSIQLASILKQLSRRGRDVIQGVHPEILSATRGDVADEDLLPVLERPAMAATFCGPATQPSCRRSTFPGCWAWPRRRTLESICAWSRARRSPSSSG